MKATYEKRNTNYEEIMNKKLNKFYLVVQIITITIPLGDGEIVEPRKIYIIYGTDIYGRKTLIGLYIENQDNSRYWIEELEKIKRRGLEKILYVSTEENRRLEQAVKMIYNPIIKISINEEVEKIAKYTQYRWKSMGERELIEIYLTEDKKEAEEKLKQIKEKYKENKIGTLLIKEFEKTIEKTQNEPIEIKHLICSYNTKRRLKQKIINVTKEYETVKDLPELVKKREEYFSMFEKSRQYSKEKWTQILNKIYEEKYEEIKEYI